MNYHAEVLCDIHFPFPPVCMKAVNLLKQQKKGRDKISPIPALSLYVFSCKNKKRHRNKILGLKPMP